MIWSITLGLWLLIGGAIAQYEYAQLQRRPDPHLPYPTLYQRVIGHLFVIAFWPVWVYFGVQAWRARRRR